jgi:hypothetical protein
MAKRHLRWQPTLLVAQRCAVGCHEADRIRWLTVEMHLEVQVRTGRVSRRADNADDLSNVDGVSFVNGWSGEHVTVPGGDVAGMGDVNVPAAAWRFW